MTIIKLVSRASFFVLLIICFLTPEVVHAQRFPATLKFKDGKELQGLGSISSKQRVKFKASQNEKPVKYSFDDLEYVVINYGSQEVKYLQFLVEGKNRNIIVQEGIVGKVSLYMTSRSGYATTSGNYGSGAAMAPGLGSSYTVNNYYLKREGGLSILHLGSDQLFSGKFKEGAATYFEDCPDLAGKLKDREKGFRKSDIEAIVKYYNANCQ